jgi:hypothetical protein
MVSLARSSGTLAAAVALAAGALVLVGAAPAGAQGVIVSPQPGAIAAMPGTQVSFLGAAAGTLSAISVVGSRTGRHSGHVRFYSSAPGESFIPNRAFAPSERVVVRAIWRPSRRVRAHVFTVFTVAQPAKVPPTEFVPKTGTPADVQSFQSEPALHPPVVTVHTGAGAASAPGYLFAAPFLGPGQWGPMIFDSAGNLVWFHAVAPGDDAADLRTQDFHGKNDLTWWQGRTITLGYGLGEDVIADANYRTVAVVRAGNGLQADEHEFNVTPQGTAYITAYSPLQANLSSMGGSANGIAVDGAIQEIDVHTGLVMWEWHSFGPVSIAESYSKVPASPTGAFDYFHINSVIADRHGNLLVSARNTWAIYDINHRSGALMWRLGGKRSSFALGPGVAFAYQHNATWAAPDEVALFDDEGAPPVNPPSRGEVVKVDVAHKSATLVSQFVRSPGPLVTNSQGNFQQLPAGGWLVGWGGLPNITEFNSQGQPTYDAQLPAGENSYRVYRLPWAGQPLQLPAIAAHAGTVYASWNGATTVVSWQLLAGPSASQLAPVSTTPRAGFETAIPAPAAAFYQVRALSASGRVLASSHANRPSA